MQRHGTGGWNDGGAAAAAEGASGEVRCGGFDRLLRRILVEAAPVHAGCKPATMVHLLDCGNAPGGGAFCLHRERLEEAVGLRARALRRTRRGTLLLFHDPSRLAAALAEPATARFLRGLGYPAEPEAALDRLAAAFGASPGGCPHEVGVFLGYPLRDVRGFMERPAEALPLRRALWRVFAPAAESLRLMARIRAARDRALGILALESDPLLAGAALRRAAAAGA